MSDWVKAMTTPTSMVMPAMTNIIGRQSSRDAPRAT